MGDVVASKSLPYNHTKMLKIKKCKWTFLSGRVTSNYVLIKIINVWSKFIVLISHNNIYIYIYIYIYGPPHH